MSTADEYTPTTGDVREGYVDAKAIYDRTASGAEFDRWLSSLLEGERARARTYDEEALAQALYRTLYDAGVSFSSNDVIPKLTATVRAVMTDHTIGDE